MAKPPEQTVAPRRFYKADQERSCEESHPHDTPQTQSPSYKQTYAEETLREKLFGAGRAQLGAPHPAVQYRPHLRVKAAE